MAVRISGELPSSAGRGALPDGRRGGGTAPVSYTHLDVYKRQDASHDGTFSVFVLRTSLEVEKQLEFFFFHCFLLAKLHFFEEL